MTYFQQTVSRMQASLYPHADITEKIVRAKKYIDEHYSADLCLDELAGEVFLSKFHFIRLFKKYYGRTPYTYLQEVRLTRATELLRNGVPIRQVCLAIGFDSIPSFTRLYKAMTGVPPARFQKRNFG